MRYVGYFCENGQPDASIPEARVTEHDIRLDWIESGERGHFTGTSSDGVTYRGTWSYRLPSWGSGPAEVRLYRAVDGEVLLRGGWTDSSGDAGPWLIRLTPSQAA